MEETLTKLLQWFNDLPALVVGGVAVIAAAVLLEVLRGRPRR